MSTLQVRHMRDAIIDEFGDRIDLSDVRERPEEEQRKSLLSRALAAFTARHIVGCSADEAADSITDGYNDQGIDAVVVDESKSRLWLIQSKWSDDGKASLNQAAAGATAHGLKLILRSDYGSFNQRFADHIPQVDQLLSDINVKITVVIALMGTANVADSAMAPLEEERRNANEASDVVGVQILRLSDFISMLRDDRAEGKVDIPNVLLESHGTMTEPFAAHYGSVPVGEVAQWYSNHGSRLFAENIRKWLGLTQVNRDLIETLHSQPRHFWYFNNGITVLCDRIAPTARYAGVPGGSREFGLAGASVVNGAQTVAAIHEAVQQDTETAQQGRVWVRLISLEDCPEDFANQVTDATNTQNQVTHRDRTAALDPEQVRLRHEFARSLDKTYVIKRGEPAPETESGCSVVEAARALACTHRNSDLAVRAKLDTDALWETGSQGAYHMLFGKETTVFRVWRCVRLARAVSTRLNETTNQRGGRAKKIADLGNFVLTHLVSQRLDLSEIDDRDSHWEENVLPLVANTLDDLLPRLVQAVDFEFGSTSYPVAVFRDTERSRIVVERVLREVGAGAERPALPDEYRPASKTRKSRSRNSVYVLVDRGRISDGAALELRPVTKAEHQHLPAWIAEDSSRGRATWVNDRTKPLLWEADGKRYTPSGLTLKILQEAMDTPPRAAQGTKYWFIPDEGSLAELTDQAREADLA